MHSDTSRRHPKVFIVAHNNPGVYKLLSVAQTLVQSAFHFITGIGKN